VKRGRFGKHNENFFIFLSVSYNNPALHSAKDFENGRKKAANLFRLAARVPL
jgi:hypothetical protein